MGSMNDLYKQVAQYADKPGVDLAEVAPELLQRIEVRSGRLGFERAIDEALDAFVQAMRAGGVEPSTWAAVDLHAAYGRDITYGYTGRGAGVSAGAPAGEADGNEAGANAPGSRSASGDTCTGWPLLRVPMRERYVVSIAGRLHVVNGAQVARAASSSDREYLMMCINALKGTGTKEQSLAAIVAAATASQPLYADPYA
jgi:hypothetical protein